MPIDRSSQIAWSKGWNQVPQRKRKIKPIGKKMVKIDGKVYTVNVYPPSPVVIDDERYGRPNEQASVINGRPRKATL